MFHIPILAPPERSTSHEVQPVVVPKVFAVNSLTAYSLLSLAGISSNVRKGHERSVLVGTRCGVELYACIRHELHDDSDTQWGTCAV